MAMIVGLYPQLEGALARWHDRAAREALALAHEGGDDDEPSPVMAEAIDALEALAGEISCEEASTGELPSGVLAWVHGQLVVYPL